MNETAKEMLEEFQRGHCQDANGVGELSTIVVLLVSEIESKLKQLAELQKEVDRISAWIESEDTRALEAAEY